MVLQLPLQSGPAPGLGLFVEHDGNADCDEAPTDECLLERPKRQLSYVWFLPPGVTGTSGRDPLRTSIDHATPAPVHDRRVAFGILNAGALSL